MRRIYRNLLSNNHGHHAHNGSSAEAPDGGKGEEHPRRVADVVEQPENRGDRRELGADHGVEAANVIGGRSDGDAATS